MRWIEAAFSALAVVALGGCSGVTVHTDVDPDADLSKYHSYQWAARSEGSGADPNIFDAEVERHIKSAVNAELDAKGFVESAGEPSFLVAWHAAIEGKMSSNAVASTYGSYAAGDWGLYPAKGGVGREWDEGTLIIDIIDAGTETLVWRSTGQSELEKYTTREEDEPTA
jgi:hypothetical protein